MNEFARKHHRGSEISDVNRLSNVIQTEGSVDPITWYDLDMDEVFSVINNCNSFVGEQLLYLTLHNTDKTMSERKIFRDLRTFFDENPEIRIEVQLVLERLGRKKGSYFLPEFLDEIDKCSLKHIWLYRIASGGLIAALMLGIFADSIFLYVAGLVFTINAVLYTLGKHKYEIHLSMLEAVVAVIQCAKCLDEMNLPEVFDDKEVLKNCRKRVYSAVHGIGWIRNKKNALLSGDVAAIIFDYIVGSTLWDFHVFNRVVKSLTGSTEEMFELYRFVGIIDASISVLSYRSSLDKVCTPTFVDDDSIDICSIAHPLVTHPIHNDVRLDKNLIVTGSNASGKSTYIKSIGVNLILAQSICTCVAESARIPEVDIMTSMAIKDNIVDGDSYYLMEIKYLKRIISHINDDRLTICIVDEILRGTNREERIAATVAILKHLQPLNCIVIIATHDILISELTEIGYMNGHFSEHFREKDIEFDYKFKTGVSHSTNAIRLLGHVGFPDSIIDYANGIVESL